MGVRKISFLFLFWSFFYVNLFGQSVVTLDDCINWAVSISSENLQKNLNEELLEVKLHDASSHIFPHLELLGSLNYYSHVPQLPYQLGYAPLSKDQYAVSMEFSQMLYDGHQFYYNRQYEKMMNRNELHKLDLSLNRIKDQVIDVYLNLLIINKKIELLAIADASINEQYENAKVLLKEGVIYGNMVSQLELEILKLQQQTEELYAIQNSLIHSLSLLTGHTLTESTFLTPEFPVLQQDLPSQRLELAIFETTLKGLDYQKKLSISKSLPNLTLYASGGYGRPTYDLFDNQFKWFYHVGLQLRVPIISWAKTAGIGDIITLQKKIVEQQRSDFEKYNQMAIQEKWDEIAKIEKQLLLDEAIVAKQAAIAESFKQQLKHGAITPFDYIKQQNEELQSQINREVHKMQLLKAGYELMALKGRL